MAITDLIAEIIKNGEKAKLAILRELTFGDIDGFELADIIRKKYYKENFFADHFITKLEKDGLIEKKERKFRLLNKELTLEILSAKKHEVDRILSLSYGKGDLTGQLNKQEKYILSKVLHSGNLISFTELYESFFNDIENHVGPFFGYANPSYARQRSQVITKELVRRDFLKADNESVRLPEAVLSDFLSENISQILLSIRQTREKNKHLLEENAYLAKKAIQFDPNKLLKSVKPHNGIDNYVVKAASRIEERSYSEAIINCYRVSEYLVKSLFAFLYPSQASERMKHEDKLKKIWNDDAKEKHGYPGIKAIASLLSVILWYRNKMAAHTEMEPTADAARTCIFSILQALKEFDRLNIPIIIQ